MCLFDTKSIKKDTNCRIDFVKGTNYSFNFSISSFMSRGIGASMQISFFETG